MDGVEEHLATGEIHGQVLRKKVTPHFTITETVYPPLFSLVSHCHERPYFSLLMEGSYTEKLRTRDELCSRGVVIFHPPEEVHSDKFQEHRSRCLNVHLEQETWTRLQEEGIKLNRRLYCTAGFVPHLARRIDLELRKHDPISELLLEGLILELVGLVARSDTDWKIDDCPTWLKLVGEVIQDRFAEPLSLAILSRYAGVHAVHLCRAFRKHFGCSPGEFLRQIRIHFACDALKTNQYSIAEIALSAGFSDQTAFSRTFKRITGQTPGQYRRSWQSMLIAAKEV
jgi:AraC family transcriptional regulator